LVTAELALHAPHTAAGAAAIVVTRALDARDDSNGCVGSVIQINPGSPLELVDEVGLVACAAVAEARVAHSKEAVASKHRVTERLCIAKRLVDFFMTLLLGLDRFGTIPVLRRNGNASYLVDC
jgi:hypothetical protein